MTADRVPAAGLLLALLATALILDFLFLLVAVALGHWLYAASLVLAAAFTLAAASVVRARR